MTQGETLFYLREIHPRWSASNVSLEKLAELHAANLIEMDGAPSPVVRLTSEGVRRKALGRRSATGGISLTRKEWSFRPRRPRKNVRPVKRLSLA